MRGGRVDGTGAGGSSLAGRSVRTIGKNGLLRGAIVKARRTIYVLMDTGYLPRPLSYSSPEKGFPQSLGGSQGSRQHVDEDGVVVQLEAMPHFHDGRAAEGLLLLIGEKIAVGRTDHDAIASSRPPCYAEQFGHQHPAYRDDIAGETRKALKHLTADPSVRSRYEGFVAAMVYGQAASFDAAIKTIQALVKEAWP